MVRENEPLYGPASPKELSKALECLYTGQANVAKQAKELRMTLERLKQLFTAYVKERPIDISDEDVWNADTQLAWPYT
tara:strand:- start:821 stop:1054 length:234 start_codon:yes stop_codon:yes gene_type:complete